LIIKEGERGTHFYVILSGIAAVIKSDNEMIAELGVGDSFGEMSLLSGEPAYPSVRSKTSIQLSALKSSDFKHMLLSYPALQIFFYRLLVNRVQNHMVKSETETINSGMNGELVYINPV
ncbi:MAG: cyclic nucleotide-binding domain-containing protein, partial [Candidatus Electrothrix sp. AR3]|nr:cyclic nucleotide-binding domain-containing protein [Candidatus Electrothrix sp. AR3]